MYQSIIVLQIILIFFYKIAPLKFRKLDLDTEMIYDAVFSILLQSFISNRNFWILELQISS